MEFFDMGGHDVYVWTVYVVSLITYVGLAYGPLKTNRKLKRNLQRELMLEDES